MLIIQFIKLANAVKEIVVAGYPYNIYSYNSKTISRVPTVSEFPSKNKDSYFTIEIFH